MQGEGSLCCPIALHTAPQPDQLVSQDAPWRQPHLPSALDINSFTPVRRLADCVETTEVLPYQRGGSHVYSVCFASTPHTCWLNCDSSDTVGFTPHICKGNHDEGYLPSPPSSGSES